MPTPTPTPTQPPPLDALPVYPDPNDRTTFAPRAFAWSKHLNVVFSPWLIALAANVKSNADVAVAAVSAAADQVSAASEHALAAEASASAAADSVGQAESHAAAAALAVTAPKWIATHEYFEGETVYSPLRYHTYRRKAALPGVSSVDPSLDRNRWEQLSVSQGDLLLAALLLY